MRRPLLDLSPAHLLKNNVYDGGGETKSDDDSGKMMTHEWVGGEEGLIEKERRVYVLLYRSEH